MSGATRESMAFVFVRNTPLFLSKTLILLNFLLKSYVLLTNLRRFFPFYFQCSEGCTQGNIRNQNNTFG